MIGHQDYRPEVFGAGLKESFKFILSQNAHPDIVFRKPFQIGKRVVLKLAMPARPVENGFQAGRLTVHFCGAGVRLFGFGGFLTVTGFREGLRFFYPRDLP